MMIGTYAVIFALRWLIQDHVPDRDEVSFALFSIPAFLAVRAFQIIRERRAEDLLPPTAE
jgi:hypothetical protein